MKFRLSYLISLFIIFASFAFGLIVYSKMPEMIASHWNYNGAVDGYMSRGVGIFLLPVISFCLFLLFWAVPLIDPKKENITKFRKYFDNFLIIITLFLFALNIFTILWNLGYHFSVMKFMCVALSAVFFSVGTLVSNAEPNWFIGIRTPWTLSSESVWRKTHKLGGKLYKWLSLLALFAAFFDRIGLWLVIGAVVFLSIFLVVYSYVEYKEEKKD